MSWNVRAKLKELLEEDVVVKEPGGRLNIALVWPGTYKTAMSALGYLSVYNLLNSFPNILAERFFYPDAVLAQEYERTNTELLSLESQRPLAEYDLIAASLSLENDYWYLLEILNKGRLNIKREKRLETDPIVIAAGVGPWSNPWPLWPFVDLFLLGEAEMQWPNIVSTWEKERFNSLPKQKRLISLVEKTRGALAPSLSNISLNENNLKINEEESILPASLPWPPPKDLLPPVSTILSPLAEFANTKLVEISRGCPYGCRFCLAGFLYRPHRPWSKESILKALGPPLSENEKVGLISPAALDHPEIYELLNILASQKRTVTLSSLRLTAINEEIAAKLAEGKLQGVAVAPEGGSSRLRAVINKNLTEEEILKGVKLLSEAGLKRLKLYFMIGLPTEEEEDLEALVELCKKIRITATHKKAKPELVVSLANFTPKAQTPFENVGMNTEKEFKRKIKFLTNKLRNIERLKVISDSPLWSIVQGILTKGGIESALLTESLYKHKGKLKPALKDINYTNKHFIHQTWPIEKIKPWRIVKPISGFKIFETEYFKSQEEKLTAPCPKELNCQACQACIF